MNLTEFHSGYRAYSLQALREIDMSRMTDDFHFDTEIIIKLQHQRMRILEVPIPTYYGTEICYVNGMKYARDVFKSVRAYKATVHSNLKAPAFAEYFAHYPLKESRGSSHRIALEMTGSGQDVLDVGCGEGYFAEKLAARGNRVTGVDFLQSPSRREAFVDYRQNDLQQGLDAPESWRGKFDRVLLLDVLEHLLDPEDLLRRARPLLRPGSGEVVVSLPNVANISVRLMLLFGIFDYTDRGIMDRTHLHFYTRKTARRMLESQGYEIAEERLTLIPVELAFRMPHTHWLMVVLNRLLALFTAAMPGLFGYQIMFRARARNTEAG
jgi:2-polyprenyl-3-methyl-5-hydroxy-6-metoxy-1,4-benzoquinol methylase